MTPTHMTVVYAPRIAAEDYRSFHELLGTHIPDSYEGWLEVKNDYVRDDMTFVGRSLVEIEIYPDEFQEYAKAHRAKFDVSELWAFAHAKGAAGHHP